MAIIKGKLNVKKDRACRRHRSSKAVCVGTTRVRTTAVKRDRPGILKLMVVLSLKE